MTYPHIQHLCNIAKHQRVLWVGNTWGQVRHTMDSIEECRIDGVTVRRAVGTESATFPEGGIIKFTTPRSVARMRGASFDHVFMDSHEYLDSPEIRAELAMLFTGDTTVERYSVIG